MKPPVRIPIISHRIAPLLWIFYYRLFRANWHNIGTCIVWFLILPIWVVWPRWTEHWSVRYIDWTFQWFPLQKDFHGISTVSTGNHGTCPSWKYLILRSMSIYGRTIHIVRIDSHIYIYDRTTTKSHLEIWNRSSRDVVAPYQIIPSTRQA